MGLVGLGQITEVHRDGYRRFGIPVVAGFDIAEAARARFAEQDPQAKVYERLEDLLADPAVGVVDLATPEFREARLPPLRSIAAAGKPVLVQKPLGSCYADAAEAADILRDAGVPGMVNQNMCFTPGVLAALEPLMQRRLLGEPFLARAYSNSVFDIPETNWFGKHERWWTLGLTVHPLSVLHLLLGPPETVHAVLGRDPAQPGVRHEGFGHLLLRYPASRYPAGLAAAVYSSGTYYGPPEKVAELMIQGPEGIASIESGSGCTLSLRASREDPDEAERHRRIERPGRWFPDAFGLVMAHFQDALARQQTPLCSVEDNLYVMALIEAAYVSHSRSEAVRLAEVMGERHDPSYGPGWLHGMRDWTPPEPLTDVKTIRPYRR